MNKLIILSSVSLLTAIMTSSVWAEKASSNTEEAVKTETSIATPEAPTAPEAPAASDSEKSDDTAIKTEDKTEAPKDENKAETPASAEKSASTADANTPELYIISPKDGEEVSSPVTVVFGLKGMGVAPAGVEKENTGHHHLLVDQAELPAAGVPMGADVQHFGGGQTQTEVELSTGEHSLQLILGDMAHVPLSPVLSSEKITIKVK